MNSFMEMSAYAGVTLSILSYMAGVYLKKKTKWGFLNPLLFSIVAVVVILLVTGVDYEIYNKSAKYLSWLLTPATVCLAIPLYEEINLLKKYYKAVLAGIFSGVLTNMIVIFALALLFELEHREYVTMLPKSITTAIGMGVSEEFGGYVSITVAVIIITGILGNILGESICKIFGIRESIAKGVAFGTSAHAIGTAKAMEIGEVEGAMSSLSIAVSGILTVIIVPIFAGLL